MKADVQNLVAAGRIVTVPERDIVVGDWQGAGYIAIDPATGAGGYIISGGLAGGSWALLLDCLEAVIQLVDLLPIPLPPAVAGIIELLALAATVHDISQAHVGPAEKGKAMFVAYLSAVAGLLVLLPLPFWGVVLVSVFEIILYVGIFAILEGGLPFIHGNPLKDCFALVGGG